MKILALDVVTKKVQKDTIRVRNLGFYIEFLGAGLQPCVFFVTEERLLVIIYLPGITRCLLRIVLEYFTDQKGLLIIVTFEGFGKGVSNEEDTGMEPCA